MREREKITIWQSMFGFVHYFYSWGVCVCVRARRVRTSCQSRVFSNSSTTNKQVVRRESIWKRNYCQQTKNYIGKTFFNLFILNFKKATLLSENYWFACIFFEGGGFFFCFVFREVEWRNIQILRVSHLCWTNLAHTVAHTHIQKGKQTKSCLAVCECGNKDPNA